MKLASSVVRLRLAVLVLAASACAGEPPPPKSERKAEPKAEVSTQALLTCSLVGVNTCASTATSFTCAVPAGGQPNDIIIAGYGDDSSTTPSATTAGGGTWSTLSGSTSTSGGLSHVVFFKTWASTDSTAPAFAGASSTEKYVGLSLWRGCAAPSTSTTSTTYNDLTGTTTITANTVTPSAGQAVLNFFFGSKTVSNTYSFGAASSGYTSAYAPGANAYINTALSYRNDGTGTAGSRTASQPLGAGRAVSLVLPNGSGNGGPGALCTAGTDCGSGYCAEGVCCNQACGGASTTDNLACTVANGATADGTCANLSCRPVGTPSMVRATLVSIVTGAAPTGVTLSTDDIYVAHVYKTSTLGAFSAPSGEGWTLLSSSPSSGITARSEIWWKRWGSGSTDDSTPTFSGGVVGTIAITTSAWRGCSNPTVAAQGSGSTSPMTAPTATLATTHNTVLRLFTAGTNSAIGAPSSGTSLYALTNTDLGTALTYQTDIAAGMTGTNTRTATGAWWAFTTGLPTTPQVAGTSCSTNSDCASNTCAGSYCCAGACSTSNGTSTCAASTGACSRTCNAGYYDNGSSCVACGAGTWSAAGATSCSNWTTCNAGTYVSTAGTSTNDRVCSACGAGTYSTTTNVSSCTAYTTCNAGQYISTAGTSTTNQVCSTCGAGTFSTTTNVSSCTAYTTCNAGEYISAAGTSTTNQTCSACGAGTFTSTTNQSSCAAWSTCAAGTYVSNTPSASTNRVCTACAAGTYSTTTNVTSCTAYTTCNAGQYVSTAGTTTTNQACSACGAGTFTSAANQSSCTAWTTCNAGQYVSTAGTSTTNRACTACGAGTFSTTTNVSSCAAWTTCNAGTYVSNTPNTTTDRACTACGASTFSSASNASSCTAWTVCSTAQYATNTPSTTVDRTCVSCGSGTLNCDANDANQCEKVINSATSCGTTCSTVSCDDSVVCTIDSCTAGACAHAAAPSSTLCRASSGALCDVAEYCPGPGSDPYYQNLTVSNTGGAAQTDFQVRLVIASANTSFWTHLHNSSTGGGGTATGHDIYVTDTSGTALSFWIEKLDNAADEAWIWVKLPSVAAPPATATLRLFYGSTSRTAGSDIETTMIVGDDFSSAGIDTTKWTVTNSGSWTQSGNGLLRLTNSNGRLESQTVITNGMVLEAKIQDTVMTGNIRDMAVGVKTQGSTDGHGSGFNAQTTNNLRWYYNTVFVQDNTYTGNLVTTFNRFSLAVIGSAGSTNTTRVVTWGSDSANLVTYTFVGGYTPVATSHLAIGMDYIDDAGVAVTHDWDWVLARKYHATPPTLAISGTELDGTGLGVSCPSDGFALAGTTCRSAADECDAVEYCSGSVDTCPGDAKKSNGTACTDDGNPCSADQCNGSSIVCQHPAGNGGTVCRAMADACDVAETCTGSSTTCPAVDGFATNGTLCRANVGACDPGPENCTGSSAACPADTYATVGIVCRASAGTCDQTETCPGSSTTCPGDGKEVNGTNCGLTGGGCDDRGTCNGSSNSCNLTSTSTALAGSICRQVAGPCDAEETCNGSSTSCPADGKLAAASAGSPVCVPYLCDGTNALCPSSCTTTSQCSFSYSCSANTCQIIILADGQACVVDYQCLSGHYCVDGVCCNNACAGGTTDCQACSTTAGAPSNGVCATVTAASNTTCRPSVDGASCDQPEICTGSSTSCPLDTQ